MALGTSSGVLFVRSWGQETIAKEAFHNVAFFAGDATNLVRALK